MSESPSKLGLHHIAIKTNHLTALAYFYETVLSLPRLATHHTSTGQVRAIWLAIDTAILMLETADDRPSSPDQAHELGWHLIALTIPRTTRETWRTHLHHHQVQIESESPYSLFIRDPDHNRIALSHYPETSL